jgi:hypothetical protein
MFVDDTNPGPLFFVARFPQGCRRRFSLMPQALAPFLGCPQGYSLGDFERFGSPRIGSSACGKQERGAVRHLYHSLEYLVLVNLKEIKTMMTPLEMNRLGYKALTDALGFDGMIRFLRQFESGAGDYTNERHQWLDQFTVEDIFTQIEQTRETDSSDSVKESGI